MTSTGRATSPVAFLVRNDPRIPDDVGWKAGYVNSVPPPWPFHFVLLWEIAIADTRVAEYESAWLEVAWTQLTRRMNGRDVILNDDCGNLRGGLYPANPGLDRTTFMTPCP